MPEMTFLNYMHMTATVQKFRWPNFWFANQLTEEPIEGTIAQWDIEKPIIDIDTDFTVPSGEAQPVRSGAYGTRTQRMPITFKFSTLNPELLAQLRDVGSKSRAAAGRSYITREQQSLQRRFGAYLDEYLVAKALTGSLTIKINGLSTVIDYGVPSSHKPTAGGAWSTPSYTGIIDDLTEWKRIVRRDCGMEPRWVVCNQTVMNSLIRNTYVQTYMAQQAGVQIAESGYITKFFGLQWIVLDHHYAQEGAVERFDTPFIPDNYLYMLPDFSPEWITMQRGTIIVPNVNKTDIDEVRGPVMWSRVTDSPTGLTLYYKNARLPAVKIPHAIIYARTV